MMFRGIIYYNNSIGALIIRIGFKGVMYFYYSKGTFFRAICVCEREQAGVNLAMPSSSML